MNKIICFLIFLIVGNILAEKPPKEVSTAIEHDLPLHLKSIFADGKERYGFQSTDQIDSITFTEPFRIKLIHNESITNAEKQNSIDPLLQSVQTDEWYSIILSKRSARAIISINYLRGAWRIGSFLGTTKSEEFHKLFKLYSTDDVVLFEQPSLNEYYLHVPKKGKQNLTSFSDIDLSNLSEEKGLLKVENTEKKFKGIQETAKKRNEKIKQMKKSLNGGVNE